MRVSSKLRKLAIFTDIHFGKKSNSLQHNTDCLEFVDWFIDNVKRQREQISHMVFAGDWFENRNSINVMTLNYAHEALKKLNSLGIPLSIIIGNHDLFHRENRKVFSTKIFDQFENITLVSEPTVLEDSILLCPYLFKDEYPVLAQYSNLPFWIGHFEFKDFIVTGTDRVMEHGPDHRAFGEPKYIFSGHFHKRQMRDNVIYCGNAFPMDYGDAWDDQRGMVVFNAQTDDIEFRNWEECPKYRKIKLSDVLNNPDTFTSTTMFPPKCRVRCTIDTEIGYSDAQQLKEEMTKTLNLREFSLEENLYEKKDAIAGDEEVIDDLDLSSLNEAVVKLLTTRVQGTATIDPSRLVEWYNRL